MPRTGDEWTFGAFSGAMFHVKHADNGVRCRHERFHVKHHPASLPHLEALLARLGIAVPEEDLEPIIAHLEWILSETETINLTAIRDPDAALRLHVVDSLAALPEVRAAPKGALLDIGTGGGYPGLPLAIASHREATLVDSVGKKARALARFVERAGLGDTISVEVCRAEELARRNKGRYAVVVARALAPLASIIELSSPHLGESGVLVALKGQLSPDEREQGRSVAEVCGMHYEGSRLVELPEGGESRELVVVRKVGPPGIALPRRDGLAQRRPLA